MLPLAMRTEADSITPRTVIAAGYMPLDVILHEGQVRHAAGGTAGNVAAILAYCGWESQLIGELGDDPAAEVLLADLASVGVSTDLIEQASGPTARVVHRINTDGHVFEYSCPACGTKFPRNRRLTVRRADEIAASVPAPTVFFFDRANPGTVRLAEHFKNAGALVAFEPAFGVDKPFARRACEFADVVKYASAGSGRTSASPPLSAREGQIQIVTDGHLGAEMRVGDGDWLRSPAFRCEQVIDAAGAGDWTTACFLLAYCACGMADASLDWAQAIAAMNCAHAGARGLLRAMTPDGIARAAVSVMATLKVPSHQVPERCLTAAEYGPSSLDDVCPVCMGRI